MIYYDLHIHTALSPCGDRDMTPNNIVNMAAIKGLDVIAITDHNSIRNAAPAMAVGKELGIEVIAGMEITTQEEVHILTLYPSIESASEIADLVYANLPDIKNRPDIFGEQIIYDCNDNQIGAEDRLLVNACVLSIDQLAMAVTSVGGAFIPAHIDRHSYSILSNLGFIPENLHLSALEITKQAHSDFAKKYQDYKILTNSDAHYLENISEPEQALDLCDRSVKNILQLLCNFL